MIVKDWGKNIEETNYFVDTPKTATSVRDIPPYICNTSHRGGDAATDSKNHFRA